jgi:hypothetical protein
MNGATMATEALVGAIPVVLGAGLLTYAINNVYTNQPSKVSPCNIYRDNKNVNEVI